MSAASPQSFGEWLQNLPLSWLVSGPIGSKEAAANAAILDGQVALIKLATKAHMPGPAPSDALAHIGGDRGLEQGPAETDASFRVRLRTAWDSWSRAGTAVEMLTQLYFAGFTGAVIAQQNGLLYSLSGAPTPGVDPTPLLVRGLASPNLSLYRDPSYTVNIVCTFPGALGTARFSVSVNGAVVATGVTPAASATGTLYPVVDAYTWVKFPSVSYAGGDYFTLTPDGNSVSPGAFATATWNAVPWWTIDGDNSHTSRFVVLFPTGGTGVNSTTVTFTGTEDGSASNPWPVATWQTAFPDKTYKVLVGAAYSAEPVFVTPDGTTKTTAGIAIAASGPFVGSVDVLAYEAGSNPFADILPADLARLSRLINRWRPAKASCASVVVIAQTPVWGYPASTTWGQSSLRYGAGSSVKFGV
jgi:hypothetical protein